MSEAKWLSCRDPNQMVDYHRMKHERRRLRLLAAACARLMWPAVAEALSDPAFWEVIDVVEQYADGAAERGEFVAARKPLRKATRALPKATPRWAHVAASVLDCLTHDAMEGMTAAVANARIVTKATGKDRGPDQCNLLRCIFGNPYRPFAIEPGLVHWNGGAAVSLARKMYEDRDFGQAPILADMLEDASCANGQVLDHLRGPGPHARGCRVFDLLLGKT